MPSLWQRLKGSFKQQVPTGNSKAGYVYNGNDFSRWEGRHFWGEGLDVLETNETIFSIVTRLSNTISSLPLSLIDGNGDKDVQSLLYKLVSVRPNPNMTAFEMWNKVETDRDCRGNGFVYIEPDSMMQPKRLWPINPDYVTPMINSEDNTLWYRIQGGTPTGTGQGTGNWLLVPSTSVIHVKHITGTPRIFGISPINVLKGDLDYDGKVLDFQLSEMGKREAFTVQYDTNVDDTKKAAVVENIRQFLKENGGVLFSEPGVTVDTIDRKLSMSDIAESDTISRRRIANAYNYPVAFLNEESTGYKSNEQLMTQFVQMTLTPIVKQYETELNAKLLSDRLWAQGCYYKFNMNGLLRGDTASRTALYQSGIRNGFMTPNEVRELEDLKPLDDLNADKAWLSGDLYPIDMDPTLRKATTVTANTNDDGSEAKDDDNNAGISSNDASTDSTDHNGKALKGGGN